MIFWPVAGPQNPKIVQNCPFIVFFAVRFQLDGWLDLANSEFLASFGVYLQMFFDFRKKNSDFLACGRSSKSQNSPKLLIYNFFACRFQQEGWLDLANSGWHRLEYISKCF